MRVSGSKILLGLTILGTFAFERLFLAQLSVMMKALCKSVISVKCVHMYGKGHGHYRCLTIFFGNLYQLT